MLMTVFADDDSSFTKGLISGFLGGLEGFVSPSNGFR